MQVTPGSLEFEECAYANDIPPKMVDFKIENTSSEISMIILDIYNSSNGTPEFPANLDVKTRDEKIFNCKDVELHPLTSIDLKACLQPLIFGKDAQPSYFNITSVLTVKYCMRGVDEFSETKEENRELHVSATYCTSILHIEYEETKIEFDSCVLGETYRRDVQVWNRSECDLVFQINSTSSTSEFESHITFHDFDSGHARLISLNRHCKIAPYSNKRIRISLSAKVFFSKFVN